jgi:hypothetical protein
MAGFMMDALLVSTLAYGAYTLNSTWGTSYQMAGHAPSVFRHIDKSSVNRTIPYCLLYEQQAQYTTQIVYRPSTVLVCSVG